MHTCNRSDYSCTHHRILYVHDRSARRTLVPVVNTTPLMHTVTGAVCTSVGTKPTAASTDRGTKPVALTGLDSLRHRCGHIISRQLSEALFSTPSVRQGGTLGSASAGENTLFRETTATLIHAVVGTFRRALVLLREWTFPTTVTPFSVVDLRRSVGPWLAPTGRHFFSAVLFKV